MFKLILKFVSNMFLKKRPPVVNKTTSGQNKY